MNKRIVEKMLPIALEGLQSEKCGIVDKKGKISKTFRGQISSFGAAISMGNFKSAIAFFGTQGGSTTERQNLIRLMNYIVKNKCWKSAQTIVEEILKMKNEDIPALREQYLHASVAIKLAMNAFDLSESEQGSETDLNDGK